DPGCHRVRVAGAQGPSQRNPHGASPAPQPLRRAYRWLTPGEEILPSEAGSRHQASALSAISHEPEASATGCRLWAVADASGSCYVGYNHSYLETGAGPSNP